MGSEMCIRDRPTFLNVSSDLLSTDALCLVIILGGQCNRPIVDFTARRYAKHGTCRRRVSVRRLHIMPHDRPETLVFKWDVL